MKFFHLGDLHFGKQLHNISLTECDQRYWVEQLLLAVDDQKPDAIVMAGDIYDRKIPSPEAMQLFDHMITELARRNVPAFIIPGNHDSAPRLSHVRELLESHRIYIAGNVQKDMLHITLPGTPDVTFWLMPYCFPKAVSDERVLNREELTSYEDAVRALLEAQDMDKTACNVLIAHQNVLAHGDKPEHSESETIIGGLGEIDVSVFDDFDYVALGHIHNAQKIGREAVRYAGCPMYYDFSELNRQKAITVVDIQGKDSVSVSFLEIPLLHTLAQTSGTFEELLEAGRTLSDREHLYVQCVLKGRHLPPRALDALKEVYGDCLIHVKRELDNAPTDVDSAVAARAAVLSMEEQFVLFYQQTQKELPGESQEALINRILEQQSCSEYPFTDSRSVPEADSQELLDALLAEMEEYA